MKYRLTVKGQVALATVVLLVFFAVVSFGHSSKSKLSEAKPVPSPTDQASAVTPVTTESDQSSSGSDSGNGDSDKADKVNVPSLEQMKETKATVYFSPDMWEIQAGEIQKITEITDILLKYRNLKIVIEGNINGSAGSTVSEFGKDLSLKRAQVVAQVLIGKGIDESRIIVKSNGSSEPVTSEQDKAWMNRRTDVYIEGFKGDTP